MADDVVRSRFAWLVKTFLLLLFIAAAVYGIVVLRDVTIRANQSGVICKPCLRPLGEALSQYLGER